MHTGPVTAGVIGRAKFAFDVWGDTVNTASRMETQGAANQIRVTDEVRNALADSYVFEGPEIVDVKGKGPTRVWTLIEGPRAVTAWCRPQKRAPDWAPLPSEMQWKKVLTAAACRRRP